MSTPRTLIRPGTARRRRARARRPLRPSRRPSRRPPRALRPRRGARAGDRPLPRAADRRGGAADRGPGDRRPVDRAAAPPRLAAAPTFAGLVRLAILDRAATPGDDLAPADAVVSPIDDAVLAQVALALRVRYDPAASHADRLRALALLARVYNEALLQLGLGEDEALPPFARLLAGRFLHCGRELVQSYTQRRVAGLEALVPAIERRLFAVSVALQSTPTRLTTRPRLRAPPDPPPPPGARGPAADRRGDPPGSAGLPGVVARRGRAPRRSAPRRSGDRAGLAESGEATGTRR
ncbi:MAG: hypothetical protein R3B09_22215 [Nannocystaceae bacterium]